MDGYHIRAIHAIRRCLTLALILTAISKCGIIPNYTERLSADIEKCRRENAEAQQWLAAYGISICPELPNTIPNSASSRDRYTAEGCAFNSVGPEVTFLAHSSTERFCESDPRSNFDNGKLAYIVTTTTNPNVSCDNPVAGLCIHFFNVYRFNYNDRSEPACSNAAGWISTPTCLGSGQVGTCYISTFSTSKASYERNLFYYVGAWTVNTAAKDCITVQNGTFFRVD